MQEFFSMNVNSELFGIGLLQKYFSIPEQRSVIKFLVAEKNK